MCFDLDSGRILDNLKAVARHPQLLTHFHEKKAQLSRRHILIELRNAQAIYDAKLTCDDLVDVVELYGKSICYNNSYLYAFCRFIKPDVVVETGVHYGSSSAFMLQALRDNHSGRLYSIDLPDTKYATENGKTHHHAIKPTEIGSYVLPELHDRWTLIIGDARKKLPELLATLSSIDIFHHDSMHTYDHMYFEYRTAWPKIRNGGVLMSHDVSWNNAFADFCSEKNVQPHIAGLIGFAFKDKVDSASST